MIFMLYLIDVESNPVTLMCHSEMLKGEAPVPPAEHCGALGSTGEQDVPPLVHPATSPSIRN